MMMTASKQLTDITGGSRMLLQSTSSYDACIGDGAWHSSRASNTYKPKVIWLIVRILPRYGVSACICVMRERQRQLYIVSKGIMVRYNIKKKMKTYFGQLWRIFVSGNAALIDVQNNSVVLRCKR